MRGAVWSCASCGTATWQSYPSTPAASSNPPRFPCAYPFLSDFRGQFWRSSGTQNGSCGISSESSRRPLSNDIKFARIGVRTRELWLPEVGVSELFLCTFPMKIPVKRGMLSANREFHVVAGVIIFPTHPGSRINLLRAGKTLRAKAALPMSDFDVLGTVGKLALPTFARFRICGKSELGLVRYGPANRGHRGVFGPFEGSFPIGIPASPDKFLAIREFHVVHGMCPSFQRARARRSTCCESGRLCAQAWQRRWENSGTFSKTLFCRPVFTRVVDVAPDVGFRRSWYRRKACVTYFLTVQALHRGEFGFARYDLANGGRRNVPYAKGGGQFDPVFGLVNGPVKPWSNLVNLGQTWSNLVKALQTLGDVSRTTFQGFLGTVGPSRVGNGSVKPRSNFVPSSESGRLGSGCLVLRADTRENPGGKNGVMTIGTKPALRFGAYRTSVRTSIGATPYSLVYGMEAVLPVEVEIPSLRILSQTQLEEAEWAQARYEQLNFIDEKRLAALCHGQLYQRRIERAYNKKARPRTFQARRPRSEEEEYGPIRSTRKVRTII
uniref:Uncharacterized protein n=1 Tax=Fagus sylvatica TaxID=28930 RepID=A0A2N9HLH0_FAGSY